MKFGHFVMVAAILQPAVSNPPFYKELSNEEAERLASWKPDDKQPMWELSGQFEGDMVLSPHQRNGLVDARLRWNNGVIPYELSSNFTAAILQLAVSNPTPFYQKPSPEEAERLASWKPDGKQQMWEFSRQYQGDMVLIPGQRNGVVDTRYRWNNREIPYELSSDFTEQEKQFITASLAGEYAKTCIKVRPRTADDKDYVYVTGKDTGCWSYVGRLGGAQDLNLQRNGCVYRGTIAHEFMHALGFYHQQGATERDDYIDILWQNIQEGYAYAFEKYGPDMITSFGQKYDYDSVMHYSKYAFSFNGQPTIIPKDPNANLDGQSIGLSTTDIIKLNKMYNCA